MAVACNTGPEWKKGDYAFWARRSCHVVLGRPVPGCVKSWLIFFTDGPGGSRLLGRFDYAHEAELRSLHPLILLALQAPAVLRSTEETPSRRSMRSMSFKPGDIVRLTKDVETTPPSGVVGKGTIVSVVMKHPLHEWWAGGWVVETSRGKRFTADFLVKAHPLQALAFQAGRSP